MNAKAPSVESASTYIRDEILRRLHEDPRLTMSQIAEYLGLSNSGFSKAMNRVTPLVRHARRIAKYLHTTPEELANVSKADARALLPKENDPTKPGLRPGQTIRKRAPTPLGKRKAPELARDAPTEPAWRAHIARVREETPDRFPLKHGCEILRLSGEDSPEVPTYLLLGPQGREPVPKERAAVLTTDGRRLIRRFTTDQDDTDTVVLLPLHEGESPIVLKRKNIREVRAVLATLDTDSLE